MIIDRHNTESEKSFPSCSGTATLQSVKPIISIEEHIGKTVGRRVPPRDAFRFAMGLQKTAAELERAMHRGLCPKGVFRFRTHEEADAWMIKMLARRAK